MNKNHAVGCLATAIGVPVMGTVTLVALFIAVIFIDQVFLWGPDNQAAYEKSLADGCEEECGRLRERVRVLLREGDQ
jgi:hypothetical protein